MLEQNPEFSSLHLDTIREIGNIGTGNAATALSKLLGRMVDMDVPVAEQIPIYEVAEHYGAPEDPVCAVLVRTEEEFSCTLIFLIPEEKAAMLANLMIPVELSGMDEEMQMEIRDSALAEQGNIILSAFLNALSQLTGWVLPTSTPSVAHDMLGSIMNVVASMFGIMGDSAMLVKTSLHIKDLEQDLNGAIIMVPDPGALEILLRRLGVY